MRRTNRFRGHATNHWFRRCRLGRGLFGLAPSMHSDRLSNRHQLDSKKSSSFGLQRASRVSLVEEFRLPARPQDAVRFTRLELDFDRRGALPQSVSSGRAFRVPFSFFMAWAPSRCGCLRLGFDLSQVRCSFHPRSFGVSGPCIEHRPTVSAAWTQPAG